MSVRYAKISSAALSILLLSGCNMFSEQKMNAYVGDTSQEYTRSYYNYAYNSPEQPAQGGYNQASTYAAPVNQSVRPASAW